MMKKIYRRPTITVIPILCAANLALSTDDEEEWGWQGSRRKNTHTASWKQPDKKLWDDM